MTDLNELIRAMQRPETYPHETGPIEVVQTQMSVVFLTGQYAYKIKKPVVFDYLDYSTLEKRRHFCQQEMELNRRLCPDAYLEVVPIGEVSNTIRLGSSNSVMEYAVKMRELPRDRMMDELLKSSTISRDMVRGVAARISDFHSKADTGKYINSFGETCAVMLNTDENFDETERYIGRSITEEQFRRIRTYSRSFLRSHAALMHDRIDQGKIRDCHGDLHAAHICFTKTGICIYDCIEFNERFRYSDVASEVAFLAMDMDRYSRHDLSALFVDEYVRHSGDDTLKSMLPFYKCYRAYVRGKVESLKLDDTFMTETGKLAAQGNARKYFDLSYSYASKTPTLIIMMGLPGTGKTTTAKSLAATIDAVVISSDVTRKQLAGIPPLEHRHEEFQAGIYAPEFTTRTYDSMLNDAGIKLANGQSVILDASFQNRSDRLRARALANEASSRFLAVECVLPDDEARRRLERRGSEASASDANWEVYSRKKSSFEPPDELPDSERIVVNTSGNWNEALARIIERTDP